MKIKITRDNEKQLTTTINDAEGKAQQRCLNYLDIEAFIDRLETHLKRNHVPKKNWTGTWGCVVGGSVTANSYKYKYNTTSIDVVRGSKDWFVTRICRAECYPGGTATTEWVKLTDEGKEAATKAFHRNLEILN